MARVLSSFTNAPFPRRRGTSALPKPRAGCLTRCNPADASNAFLSTLARRELNSIIDYLPPDIVLAAHVQRERKRCRQPGSAGSLLACSGTAQRLHLYHHVPNALHYRACHVSFCINNNGCYTFPYKRVVVTCMLSPIVLAAGEAAVQPPQAAVRSISTTFWKPCWPRTRKAMSWTSAASAICCYARPAEYNRSARCKPGHTRTFVCMYENVCGELQVPSIIMHCVFCSVMRHCSSNGA